MKAVEEYYLGLDIGTSSVGWAVTDPSYNILEYRRKAMWGIHLFDEGQTAAERRMHRCNRRRLDRRNQRIMLLRELMSEEVCKVDPAFFERLDESGLQHSDRKKNQPNSLFDDPDMKDVDFFNRFPTIYHLRRYLISTDEKPDIRFVYLALHHIVKYRGHFLFAGISEEVEPSFKDVFNRLLDDLGKYGIDLIITDTGDIERIMSDRSMTVSDKKRMLQEAFPSEDKDEEKIIKALIGLLAGAKVKLSDLFSDSSLEESMSFKESNAEDQIAEIEDIVSDDQMVTLRLIKQLYDWSVLSSIMKGYAYISDAKIASYEEHAKDLSDLKKVLKPDKVAYDKMFKSPVVAANYCSYTGMCSKGNPKKCRRDEFYKYCMDVLKGKEDETSRKIIDCIDRGIFMPKQSSSDNSVLPYSVHLKEMKAILSNASKWYPFLTEIQSDGMTVSQKIEMILKFRIPYYVGPLNNRSPNSWIVRRMDEKTYPWNFDQVVDVDASADAFMANLTNYCSYLIGEKVLPKNSVLYSYFSLYNELNNIRLNGDRLDISLKRRIVKDLFEDSNKSVTEKGLLRYLKNIGTIEASDSIKITGMDEKIKTNLNSLHQIRKIIGDKANDRSLVESIIRTVTVFSGSDRTREVLMKGHSDVLSKQEIDRLARLGFTGWGRLSEKLLTGLYDVCRETGTSMNIMGLLENTQDNFMEILHKYSFNKQIEALNAERNGISDRDVQYSDLDDLGFSPAVKRGIWRAVEVVKDVADCAGHPPSKIFVETTREHLDPKDKKRTNSRKDALMSLYRKCKEESEWIESLDGQTDESLKSRALYLYYTQLGRCMYCGRKIDIEELGNKEVVDLDHIYPQSKIKDDSIHQNLVLTCKTCNENKSNRYPIDLEIQNKMGPTWRMLQEKGYITSEKYARLTRTDKFTDDELERFISRQIVETSQSVKGTISILKRMFPETDVVYVKAETVTKFRKDNKLVKCRSVNDYHHAKDAYLNIVVGNAYDTKFTKDLRSFLKTHEEYNMGKMFNSKIARNGIIAWIPGEDGSIITVRKYMRRDNIQFVKYSYIQKGMLFDENPVSKSGNKYPRKKGLSPLDYGGYDNVKGACYSLVEYEEKGKIVRSLENLPVMEIGRIGNVTAMNEYYSEKLGCEARTIVPVIRMNTLFEWGGFPMHIGARTGNSIVFYNGVELLLPDDMYQYCRNLYKYSEDKKQRIFNSPAFYSLVYDSNIKLFETLYEKAVLPPYSERLKAFKKNIDDIRRKFLELDLTLQADILNEMLHAFQCSPTNANLKKAGGVGVAGRIIVNKKLPEDIPVFIVNQSPSGLRSNKIRLNP